MLLILFDEAISEISSVKTITELNSTRVMNVKVSLKKTKVVTKNLLKEEENEKQQTLKLMSKNLKEIKKLLKKSIFAQIIASELSMNHLETFFNQIKLNTAHDKMKKQQRDKFTIIITAATASNII